MARPSLYEFKKEAILDTIERLTTREMRPSFREVADVVDVPIGTFHDYLGRLRREGLVTWDRKAHRTLRLTEQGERYVSGRSET